jgi:alanyl-tRNA synthetase
MKSAREIREAFLYYFEARHSHRRVRSASLVPGDDPTLLFTNAGMVQFKDLFTGAEKRDYTRAATSQKCLRVSGKHNDLENVGRTARHHTFFEMLGNFSFGDYFKEGAIEMAWDFVTNVMGLSKDRLVVTVFNGEGGLPADDEARAFWARHVSPDRIFALGRKDNFWSMGATGPCGPCSEIHYYVPNDHPRPDPASFAGGTNEAWVEIWNLVFMQFDLKADGALVRLPAPSVDTGMGLERLACVVQGHTSNYDSDLFAPLLGHIAALAGKRYTRTDGEDDVSMRVIADHARATAFLVADGVLPSNEGRGYVLRRVMRRAIRHGKKLGLEKLFLHEAAVFVADAMGADYRELRESRSVIEKVASQEEARFRETIGEGLRLLAENEDWERREGTRVLPGRVAFVLYDTFGFPIDLVDVIGAEQGFEVDHAGFEAEMTKQRERSRAASHFGAGPHGGTRDYHELLGAAGPLSTDFIGYESTEGDGKVLALLVGGKRVQSARQDEAVEVVTTRTPFYAESGGQIGDTGTLTGKGFVLEVQDTQRPLPGLRVHRGIVKTGTIHEGDEIHATVDAQRRQAIRLNHSATHLAHWALRRVLGDHVKQAGSLVAPDRLRFDFSHFGAMTDDQIAEVEALVNQKVRENWNVEVEELPIEAARRKGAIAMFGEKYGEIVRVVTVSPDSVEFCGGTHVARSGDIGFFRLTREEGVAAGVRRIEAVTGLGALEYVRNLERQLTRAGEMLRVGPHEVADRVEKLLAAQRAVERELDALKKKMASQRSADVMSEVREVAGVKLLAIRAESGDAKSMREFGDKLRDRLGSGVLVLGGVDGEKVTLLAMVTPDLVSRFHAGKIVGELAKIVGGRGGGRPEMAQGGGNDPARLDAALAAVPGLLA